ncbi:MAG: hypothetical protein JRH18_23700 [Deltaproteobacteria bacterium]|nr:hypothetical protein [Deltaproteobacteria bacterium]
MAIKKPYGGEIAMDKQRDFDLEKMDDWYTAHFEELVKKYGGKAIAVVEGKIVAVADTEKEADQMARETHPDDAALVLSIPMEEELVCLL